METSIFPVCGLLSTKTGTKPFCKIGPTVVGKPAAQVMTSSPFNSLPSSIVEDVSVPNAIKLAEDPEFTRVDFLTPR